MGHIGLLWTQMSSGEGWQLFFPVPVAAALALIAVVCSNHDTIHRILRFIKVTRETSYPSEWYSAFAENDDCYVILHFHDGRRLYGWPQEWPGRPAEGHFLMALSEWLASESDESVPAGGIVVVPHQDVAMVEFVTIDSVEETEEEHDDESR